jgi:hypothetical protein
MTTNVNARETVRVTNISSFQVFQFRKEGQTNDLYRDPWEHEIVTNIGEMLTNVRDGQNVQVFQVSKFSYL